MTRRSEKMLHPVLYVDMTGKTDAYDSGSR